MSCTRSTDTTPPFLIVQKPLGPPRKSSRSPLLVVELGAIIDLILIQPAMCAGFGCTSNRVWRIASRTIELTAGSHAHQAYLLDDRPRTADSHPEVRRT
jgi:hypothetical protein